jgi:hypothetical protein
MATVAATKKAPPGFHPSARMTQTPSGARQRLASATEDHRKIKGSWARLARAFQPAWISAAARTRESADPLTEAKTLY